MTNAISTGPINHVTDADFRAWGSELSAALDALGLFPKSADSGQIDWTTVSIPGINTSAGYEIRYLNDSQNSAAPVYVKFEFGTAGQATYPEVWCTIGQGSDGAGGITGTIFARRTIATNSVFTGNSTNTFPSYYCAVDGFVGFLFKSGAMQHGFTGLVLQRTVDDSGAPTAEGLFVFFNRNDASNFYPVPGAYTYQSGLTTGPSSGGSSAYLLRPYGSTGHGPIGSPPAYQMFRHFAGFPESRPLLYTVSADPNDTLSAGTTFQLTPVGTTPRSYIVLPPNHLCLSSDDNICMIWE